MSERPLSLSVMKWPKHDEVIENPRNCFTDTSKKNPEFLRIGYHGSYTVGKAGVGRDLDMVVIVEVNNVPMEERGKKWYLSPVPVPVDLLVFTSEEWNKLSSASPSYSNNISRNCVWIFSG